MFENLNIFTTDKEFFELIYTAFESYCKFMNMPLCSMPKFKINIFTMTANKNFTVASVDFPSPNSPIIKLNLCKEMFVIRKDNATPLLFHEFTHIYDYWRTKSDRISQQSKIGAYAFDEFHATIVQLMTGCGIDNYAAKTRLPLDLKFYDGMYSGTLLSYFRREIQREKKLNVEYTSQNSCTNIIHQLFYYIGKNYFYENYCAKDINIVFEYDVFCKLLGDGVLELRDELFHHEINIVDSKYFTEIYDKYISIELYLASLSQK